MTPPGPYSQANATQGPLQGFWTQRDPGGPTVAQSLSRWQALGAQATGELGRSAPENSHSVFAWRHTGSQSGPLGWAFL